MRIPFREILPAPEATPFDLVRDSAELRIARKSLVLRLCRHLEQQAAHQTDPPVIIATFQRPEFFTAATQRRYHKLAAAGAAVILLGVEPAPSRTDLHCVALAADDPLLGEWSVVVVGPHYASTLIARELDNAEPHGSGRDRDRDRRFEFLVSHVRPRVVSAGNVLLSRLR